MHRDVPVQKAEKSPGARVVFSETVSVSSSEHQPTPRADEEQDVEDRDEEFDNELFYSKYSMFRHFAFTDCASILTRCQ